MKTTLGIAALACVSVIGCKKDEAAKSSEPMATVEKAAPASVPTAPTPDSPPLVKAENKPVCVLDGNYRFRFSSNGSDGWWFRFKVDGDTASLVEPAPVLGLNVGELELTKNTEGCSLTVATTSSATGKLTARLQADPASNALTGTLTREKVISAGDESHEVSGSHDHQAPSPPSSCIVPGNYKFSVPTGHTWNNSEADDDRDCTQVSRYDDVSMVLKLEPYGKTIALTLRESEPPYAESSPGDSLETSGGCNAVIKVRNDVTNLDAQLAFSADGITGKASRIVHQIIEDGPQGDGIWDCVATEVPLTITKLP